MSIRLWLTIGLGLAWLAGCATNPQRPQELRNPTERIALQGYSLMPVNEPGWLVLARNGSQIALAKRGVRQDASIAIQGSRIQLPEFKSSDELIQAIRQTPATDSNSQRFNVSLHDVTLFRKQGQDCALRHVIAQDNAAVKRTTRPGFMVLEAISLTCPHPDDRRVGVNVAYSQRAYPGDRDAAFSEKAMTVLQGVEFSPLSTDSPHVR